LDYQYTKDSQDFPEELQQYLYFLASLDGVSAVGQFDALELTLEKKYPLELPPGTTDEITFLITIGPDTKGSVKAEISVR